MSEQNNPTNQEQDILQQPAENKDAVDVQQQLAEDDPVAEGGTVVEETVAAEPAVGTAIEEGVETAVEAEAAIESELATESVVEAVEQPVVSADATAPLPVDETRQESVVPQETSYDAPVSPYATTQEENLGAQVVASGDVPPSPYAAVPQEAYSSGAPASPYTNVQQDTSYDVPPVQLGGYSYSTQPFDPQGYQSAQPAQSSGKVIGSLVCGILAIVLSVIPIVGIILGIVAIVLAVQSVKQVGKNSKATAGKICGIVGIVFSVLVFIFFLFLIASIGFLANLEPSSPTQAKPSIEAPAPKETPDPKKTPTPKAPTKAVEEEVKAAAEESLSRFTNMSDIELNIMATAMDSGFSQSAGASLADFGVDPLEFAHWLMDDFDYRIDDATVNESKGTAEVDVVITMHDINEFVSEFETAVDDFIENGDLDSIETEEDLYKVLGDMLRSSMEKTSTSTTEIPITLDLTKGKSGWTVDDSWEDDFAESIFF